MRFIAVMTFFAVSAFAGIMVVDRAMSGNDVNLKLTSFNHWTVRYHWVDPERKVITVLLDEAVDITDASCASVLHMLDRLSQIAPAYEIFLVSGNKDPWVPLRNNPVSRAEVVEMVNDEKDYARNAYEFILKMEEEDPDGRFLEWQRAWSKRFESREHDN